MARPLHARRAAHTQKRATDGGTTNNSDHAYSCSSAHVVNAPGSVDVVSPWPQRTFDWMPRTASPGSEMTMEVGQNRPAGPSHYLLRLWTLNSVSFGGFVKPPLMPFFIAGIRTRLRKLTQLFLDTCTATIVQPPVDGPAA